MRGPDDLADEEDDENDSVRYGDYDDGTDLLLLHLPPPRARDGTHKARDSSINWERPLFEKPDQDC